MFTFTAETPLPAGRQGDRREGLVFDLVVRGHQIKSPQFFRDVNGRRPGASGESVVNPEPHVVRGLSPILQRNHPLSAASEPRTSHAPAGRVGGEKGCEDVYYFVLPLLTISIGPSWLSNKNEPFDSLALRPGIAFDPSSGRGAQGSPCISINSVS